jgi:hypothetical protein
MRQRPPFTVVAYVALFVAILLVAVANDASEVSVVAAGVLWGAGLVGLYFGVRIAWIVLTVLQVGNLGAALLDGAPWWAVAILVAQLALLLSPPTRRYFRRPPREPKRTSGALRVVRLSAVGLVALLGGLLLLAVLFPGDPIGGDLKLVRSERAGVRVLFVGNTLTSDHSMIRMIRELGEADRGAPRIFAVQYARRGSTLEDALDDQRLTDLLREERWNEVVLQEHSQLASRPDDRKARMLPAATALDRMARQAGARTVLFITGAYVAGDRGAVSGDTYRAMQTRLNLGYYRVASRLSAALAPVGSAWGEALHRQPGLDLWGYDGRRPSETGSYLTACVFYTLLTRRDPAGSSFTARLEPALARSLQRVAWYSVRQMYPGWL